MRIWCNNEDNGLLELLCIFYFCCYKDHYYSAPEVISKYLRFAVNINTDCSINLGALYFFSLICRFLPLEGSLKGYTDRFVDHRYPNSSLYCILFGMCLWLWYSLQMWAFSKTLRTKIHYLCEFLSLYLSVVYTVILVLPVDSKAIHFDTVSKMLL